MKPSETTDTWLRGQKAEVAAFIHRNESMHRHSNISEPTCDYCSLMAHYAIRTLERLLHENALCIVTIDLYESFVKGEDREAV